MKNHNTTNTQFRTNTLTKKLQNLAISNTIQKLPAIQTSRILPSSETPKSPKAQYRHLDSSNSSADKKLSQNFFLPDAHSKEPIPKEPTQSPLISRLLKRIEKLAKVIGPKVEAVCDLLQEIEIESNDQTFGEEKGNSEEELISIVIGFYDFLQNARTNIAFKKVLSKEEEKKIPKSECCYTENIEKEFWAQQWLEPLDQLNKYVKQQNATNTLIKLLIEKTILIKRKKSSNRETRESLLSILNQGFSLWKQLWHEKHHLNK